MGTELKAALADIVDVDGADYKSVDGAITKAYNDKKAKSEYSNLDIKIQEFKQKLTQKVSDFNAKKDDLAAVYDTYDAEKKAADELVEKAEDFLKTYKQAVDKAVKDFLDFIEANDKFKTVANLTDAAVSEKTEAIKAAKEEYTKQAGIYADYKTLKAEVEAQTTSLDGVKDDIDKDAKDTKKLSEEKFKPTTLWNTTITDIVDKITALDGAVETNKTDATAFKAKDDYKKTLQTIKDAIKSLKDNALQATALFAGFDDEYNTANELQKALINPDVEPTDDLTKLNVWTNQVTIDDAVKARTPYKNFIDNTEGSITKVIAALKAKLNVMDANGPLKEFKGTILDYLKTDAVKNAATAVTTGTATMEAIKANYKADEQKFAQQMDIEECNGIRTNINNKAVVFEAAIDALEKNIKDGLYGVVKGKKLQDELDAITKKIDDAKAVAAKEDATKDDLTKAYNSIKDLMDTDIKAAQANAKDYADAFEKYQNNYNELNGNDGEADGVGENTVCGLKVKVNDQKKQIDTYKDLTEAQKNTFKGNVDAVEYVKKDGDKDVKYTIENILTFIENARDAETLTDEEVTKYQGIISGLKDKTYDPVIQAQRMNKLEGELKGIDLAKAAADVLKKDSNGEGYFYLLVTGKYTNDFNDLKAKIEADKDITAEEVGNDITQGTYEKSIADLKALVDGAADAADANLKAFKDAKNAYDRTPADGSDDVGGAVQRYFKAWDKLKEFKSSKLEEQMTVIEGMKAKLDQLGKEGAKKSYDEGTAVADDFKTQINNQIKAIEEKVEEYTNEANYNAQVAADNKAVYDRILAARIAVDAVYATSATVINTYKNFQSTELKAAANQAKDELEALLTYLNGYATAVGKIEAESDDVYGKTVSPDFFDKDETYKAEYEKIQKEIEDLTKALTDKINEFAGAKVAESVKNYTDAIDASRTKVAKFSVGKDDLTTDELDDLFEDIDDLLKAINDVKEDGTKINLLDAALVAAAKEKTGISALIPPVEQKQAQKALNDIIAQNTNSNLLPDDDLKLFNKIKAAAESTSDTQKVECVNKFSTWKANLNDLKAKADQIAKDNKAIADAKTAITNANEALGTLNLKYQEFAAGYQVKETVEQIAADLAAYDATKVTATNAADWEAAAKAISERIEAVYVALYDFEVPFIEGLIAQAREELLTYSGDKATMAKAIDIQEGNLKEAKDDVAAYLKDPKKGKSQKDALLDLDNIESALNDYIKAMKDANGTNLDAVIVANLEAEVKVQEDILDAAPANYSAAIQTALTDEFKAIKDDITTLRKYITTHKDEMSAYQANAEAMLKDIKDAIVALKAKADDLKAKEEADAAEKALIHLAETWDAAQDLLDAAEEDIAFMEAQLEAYGNGSKYANKVSKLNDQFVAAKAILTDAKAEADGKEKTADKQKVADKAVTDITTALNGLKGNCKDVVALSKAAYIKVFVDDLEAQIIEDSWSKSDNYTTTDKKTLTNMRTKLFESLELLRDNAANANQAADVKNAAGEVTEQGVLSILNEGATQFGKDLNALVQAVKDLSLAEDVKGHITGGDEIGADDVQALINIIINGQEGEQNLEVCDINGDGRITVTDIIWLQFFDIFHEWPNMAATARGGYEMSDAVKMEVVSTRGNITRLAINLSNNDSYRAFQIGMQLPAGAKVVGQSLGDRVENAYLMHSQATEGNVRFMTIAFNSEFAGNEGAVLYVDVENLNGDVALTEAYFTNVELNEADLLSSGQTTSIRESITNALESAGQKIYNMGGRVMNGLKKGINIIRRNDGSNEKVIVK